MSSAASPLPSPLVAIARVRLPLRHGAASAEAREAGARAAEAQEVQTDQVQTDQVQTDQVETDQVEAEERAAPGRPPGQALALVPPAAAVPASELGATTLRLVEHSMETIQALHARVETISDQARDLIRLTHRERVEQQGELDRVRAEATTWRRQAMELEIRLREAQLRVREAEMAQREADAAALEARQQACAAEAEVRGLESYLRRISDFLQANLGRGPVRPSRGG